MSISNPIFHPPISGPTDSVFHFVGPRDPAEGGAARPVMPGMYWLDNQGVRLRLRRRSEDNKEWVEVAGAFPVDTGSINMEFDPVSGNLFAFVVASGVSHAELGNLGTNSHPQYLLRTDFPHDHDHGTLIGLADDDHKQYLLRTDFPHNHDHGTLTGLGDDDHPQYVPKSMVNAKGDVLVGSANDVPTVVSIGPNGTTFTADSTRPTGHSWALPPIDVTLGPFYLSDLSSTAVSEMYLSYATSPKLVEPGPPGTGDYVTPTAGFVVAVFLNADTPRTAGTAEVRIRKNGQVVPFAAGGCTLNATRPLRASAVDWTGFPLAAGDTIGLAIATTGWAPTSGDVRARVVIRMLAPSASSTSSSSSTDTNGGAEAAPEAAV